MIEDFQRTRNVNDDYAGSDGGHIGKKEETVAYEQRLRFRLIPTTAFLYMKSI